MRIRLSILTAVLSLIILSPLPARADIPTMTVSELSPGMRGLGYTVAQGTEIEEFNCEIIDIFTDMGYNGGPLILLRIWGDVVDETGGIAGGYSGSPVFIDGKLIGALSWGPWFTEGDVAGATPIHEMLRAFTYPEEPAERIARAPVPMDEPITVAGRTFNSVLVADSGENPSELERIWGDDTLIMTPAHTPLIVSGLSDRGFERLQEFAQDRLPYIDLIKGPGGGSSQGVPILLGPTHLEPGASIGAQLASGDLDLTAVGTLTWIDDDGRFLAFGHPFLADGPTNLPFVTSRIIYTMPALDRSYKLGEAIEVVGTITQDRLTACGGYIRQIPDMVDCHLEVIDHDVGRTRRYNYSVISKEDWLPFLAMMMPIEGLTYASDRLGPGTCRVSFSIRGEGLAKPIERDNLIYTDWSVASGALMEFTEALGMVTYSNPFREVKITEVDIHVEITSARQTMDIIRARYQNPPNMGPGAVGYAGPEEEDDKEAKDDAINEAREAGLPYAGEMQDMPFDEAMMMQAMESMEAFDMGYIETKLVGYHPGDTIEVLITLRPHREDPIEKVIELEIPDDFPIGQTMLEVLGGTSASFGGMYLSSFASMGGMWYNDTSYGIPPEDLDEVIEDFVTRDVNNSLIVRLMRMGPDDPYYYLQDDYEPLDEVRASITLEDVIYGYYTLPIEIISEEEEEIQEETWPEEYMPDMEMPFMEEPPPSGSRNPYRN